MLALAPDPLHVFHSFTICIKDEYLLQCAKNICLVASEVKS